MSAPTIQYPVRGNANVLGTTHVTTSIKLEYGVKQMSSNTFWIFLDDVGCSPIPLHCRCSDYHLSNALKHETCNDLEPTGSRAQYSSRISVASTSFKALTFLSNLLNSPHSITTQKNNQSGLKIKRSRSTASPMICISCKRLQFKTKKRRKMHSPPPSAGILEETDPIIWLLPSCPSTVGDEVLASK